MPELLRVVGPPGAGKSLLITSLMDSLRSRGYRTASAVQRDETTTVITLSTGSRSTIERAMPATYLPTVIEWIDPTVAIVFAEGYEDPGSRAVEVRPDGAAPHPVDDEDLFGVVESEALAAAFAQSGPGDTNGLADRVLQEILGDAPHGEGNEPAQPEERGFGIGRLLRRLGGR